MSDVHQKDDQAVDNQENEVVSKKAYQEVSRDMLKYKSEMKELKAQLEAAKADQEARENATLREQEKYAELYKKSEAKLAEIAKERDSERNKFVTSHKINEVVKQLGGFKKNDYNKFINTDSIELSDDGSVIEDSVSREVDRIRKEYPELIKATQAQSLPNAAPIKMGEKSYSEMTEKEKHEAKVKLMLAKK